MRSCSGWGGICMEEVKAKKRSTIVISPCDRDEEAMTRFAREHPKYVQAEQELFWKRDVEQKDEEEEDEAGPLTVIPIESLEEDWGDSNEEDEGCDDTIKDRFWTSSRARTRSSSFSSSRRSN
ncbi:AP2-containing protein [Hordeum vulgare]|nr:AP2-containing protein [Hordeum vulgare]